MAEVFIEGVYMNSEVKTSTFDGVSKSRIQLDLYQQNSPSNEKTVSLRTEDLTLINFLKENFDFGSVIKVKALVNAYQNRAYFKLIEVVE